MKKVVSAALLSSCVAFAIGCNGPAANPPAASPSAEGVRFRLTTEPASAQDVKAARESAKDEEEVTLVGRIGGDVDPWVEGQAAFMIVDNSLKPCNENGDDACLTPWDYCCDTDVLPQSKAMVKIVGDDGRPLSTDARKLLGVKELQTVVVHGKAKRDDSGNLTVLADGVFVRN
jgi:hypothetical protein